jgi:hypothetical protein
MTTTLLQPFIPIRPYEFLGFSHCMLALTLGYFAVIDQDDYERNLPIKWLVRFNGWGKAIWQEKDQERLFPASKCHP